MSEEVGPPGFVTVVCPTCKSGEHLVLRLTLTAPAERVMRSKDNAHHYYQEFGTPDYAEAKVHSAHCTNCGWHVEVDGNDPWSELIEEEVT